MEDETINANSSDMPPRNVDRLERQLQFVVEIDKLKRIRRQTLLMDRSRQENSAEHSWHLAVMVILLSEYAASKTIDVLKVLKMVIIHDLIEIDAGDTFCYDVQANNDKNDREAKAANRIFGLLPHDQAPEFRSLWDEFEEQCTPEACFATALDRIQPVLHNYHTQGGTWRKFDIKSRQVFKRIAPAKKGAPILWSHIAKLIRRAIKEGMLRE